MDNKKRKRSMENSGGGDEKDKINEIMNSVPSFDGPSSSVEAEKMRKLSTAPISKRHAVDDIQKLNSENDPPDIVGFQKGVVEETVVKVQPSAILTEVSELEKVRRDIKDDIKSLRRSMQYDMKKLNNKVDKIEIYMSTTKNVRPLSDIQSKLNLKSSISDVEKFNIFDNEIKTNKEFAETFREFLNFKSRAKSLHEAIAGVLSTVMSQDLQIKFSACGKPNKGIAKFNLSATCMYSEFKDTLLKQFQQETESTILSKLSRWLANAKDRHGGRHSR